MLSAMSFAQPAGVGPGQQGCNVRIKLQLRLLLAALVVYCPCAVRPVTIRAINVRGQRGGGGGAEIGKQENQGGWWANIAGKGEPEMDAETKMGFTIF